MRTSPILDDLPPSLVYERIFKPNQFQTEFEQTQKCGGDRICTKVFVNEAHWEPKPTGKLVLRVAFDGGTPALRGHIIETARIWTQHSKSIEFDFGCAAPRWENCYGWTPPKPKSAFPSLGIGSDTLAPASDIRISFSDKGYWSAMGREASRLKGRTTMSFQDFAMLSNDDLNNWHGSHYEWVVLHEFGHALGFAHELIHPKCQSALDWAGDAAFDETKSQVEYREVNGQVRKVLRPDWNGNRPGLLRFYDALYDWTEPQIRAQFDRQAFFKKVADGLQQPITTTESDVPDRTSVMMYWTTEAVWRPAPGGRSGLAEPTCVLSEHEVRPELSAFDLELMQHAYP